MPELTQEVTELFRLGRFGNAQAMNLAYSAVRKALPGERLALFATGLTTSPSGVVPGRTNFRGVTASIAGVDLPVEFAGLVAAGQFQINVALPDLPPGDHSLQVHYNGQVSQSGVLLPVGAR